VEFVLTTALEVDDDAGVVTAVEDELEKVDVVVVTPFAVARYTPAITTINITIITTATTVVAIPRDLVL
jgi:hypothetical protein